MNNLMLTFAKKFGNNIHSQNGEDGIIAECLKRMKLKGVCIEFGASDGYYCSNTRQLIEQGWTGYMYDVNPGAKNIVGRMITEMTVNELPECNLISIDIDGNDLKVWKAYEGKPDIVIIEINSSLPPDKDYFNPVSGASYKIMVETGIGKGYFLLCHTGNLIFLLNKYRELFPEVFGNGLNNWSDYFNKSWL